MPMMTMETGTAKRDQLIQTRVTTPVKDMAVRNAERLGLSLSTVLSIMVAKFAVDGEIPAVSAREIPNEETLAAFAEIENGGGTHCKTAEEMFNRLGI